MGYVMSKLSTSTSDTQIPRNLKFRVLIIGRANAGKTSILQRVCDTTEGPKILRLLSQGGNPESEQVRSRSYLWRF
jgi:GTP-binding protein EngB required for normal cell division